jgi:hypothetical protein
MEFESTLKDEAPKSEVCVVYDKQDGRIVHVHEFIGDGTGVYGPQGQEERARVALEGARGLPNAPKQLQVLHVAKGFQLAPNTVYRVDVAKGKLVSRAAVKTAPARAIKRASK